MVRDAPDGTVGTSGPGNLSDVDVCIIGSGPDALSVLSALHEPFAKLSAAAYNRAAHNRRKAAGPSRASVSQVLKVCVVSPSGEWLSEWQERFEGLAITHLRSPASAHPDLFSAESLLEFAHCRGRGAELVDVGARHDETLNKRAPNTGRLTDMDEGLFDIPSQGLFLDFCRDLAGKLPHTLVRGRVVSIEAAGGEGAPRMSARVLGDDGSHRLVTAKNVVLAVGAPGPSLVPKVLRGVPPQFCTHTNDVRALEALKRSVSAQHRVLVVGGGLSAVQAAIALAKLGARVTLCSRRPLTWRHFDLPVPWFDRRTQNMMRFEFLSERLEDRAAFIRRVKGGGSVPPWYRRQLAASGVEHVVGSVAAAGAGERAVSVALELGGGARVDMDVDHIVLGTGSAADCLALPLLADLHERHPTEIFGGLPAVGRDLRWAAGLPVFVVGGLAALELGPDASNLMGARRAAEIVAQHLGAYDELESADKYNVHTNLYAALEFDEDSSEEDEDEDEDEG